MQIFIRYSVFIVCFFAVAAVRAADIRLRLPVNAEVVSEDVSGESWRQNCRIGVSYTAAVNQLRAVIGQQGWVLKHTIQMGAAQSDRCLMTFTRGRAEVTVMAWKVGVGETGFSWGSVKK
jgi:hypothetical protein